MSAPVSTFAGALPPLYARWIADLLPHPVIAEPRATCGSCAMVPREDAPARAGETVFVASTKCCTFLPVIPNFLVGAALLDRDPETAAGRATVEARIDRRAAVTPLGLGRTAVYGRLYREKPEAFGRVESFRCPHFLSDGRCGVWKHREGTCSTWFCKHDRGVVSKRFWRALQRLLSVFEDELAYWVVRELGADNDAVRGIYEEGGSQIEDEVLLEDEYRACWGPWRGRERELFHAATQLIEPLSYIDVARICGPQVAELVEDLGETSDALESRELPERLSVGPVALVRIGGLSARIFGYSEFDSLDVPRGVFDALPQLEGLTVEAALDRMMTRHGVLMTRTELGALIDMQVLVSEEETIDDPPAQATLPPCPSI